MRPSKRDTLVSNALDVFYQNGFHATGMDKVAAETGISKTAIYNNFRTKDDLILAVLRLRDERFRNWLFRRMAQLGDTPQAQLMALFDVLEEWFQTPEFKGCMFIKAVGEFQDRDHPIFRQSVEHKKLIEEHLLTLAHAAALHDPRSVVGSLMVLKEGAIVSAQMGLDEAPATRARAAAKLVLEASARPAAVPEQT